MDVINKAKGRVVIVKVMDVGEDIIKSKCAGQIDDCLGEIVILRTSDPERIKHRKDVEVLDVFDLGGEYAVAVRASIDALIDIMGDEKVREAERDRWCIPYERVRRRCIRFLRRHRPPSIRDAEYLVKR